MIKIRAKGPTRKETSSRSNSLSRAGSKPNITVAKRTKQDVLSQSVRTESKTRYIMCDTFFKIQSVGYLIWYSLELSLNHP